MDITIHEKQIHFQEADDAQGINNILKRLSYYQVERIVMEATRRYEFALAEACYIKGSCRLIA
ncbi:hypothetical protein AB835_10515 [Candidatus Endobugula sertula]|uniref:Transposase n=1 Tax=Candidatus Endobugula sertula TaxID=62101 RepID=A0A1D2QNK2_9GAMM|nr:hypothetical protein AB835_10515 [Candidatus Endobugula sertula]